jgi:hypothetical protein
MTSSIGEFALLSHTEGTVPDYAIQLDDEPVIDVAHLAIVEMWDEEQ